MFLYIYNFKSYKYINLYCVFGLELSGREYLVVIVCISVVLCKKKCFNVFKICNI